MFYSLGVVCLIIFVGRLLLSWWDGDAKGVYRPSPKDRWPFR